MQNFSFSKGIIRKKYSLMIGNWIEYNLFHINVFCTVQLQGFTYISYCLVHYCLELEKMQKFREMKYNFMFVLYINVVFYKFWNYILQWKPCQIWWSGKQTKKLNKLNENKINSASGERFGVIKVQRLLYLSH